MKPKLLLILSVFFFISCKKDDELVLRMPDYLLKTMKYEYLIAKEFTTTLSGGVLDINLNSNGKIEHVGEIEYLTYDSKGTIIGTKIKQGLPSTIDGGSLIPTNSDLAVSTSILYHADGRIDRIDYRTNFGISNMEGLLRQYYYNEKYPKQIDSVWSYDLANMIKTKVTYAQYEDANPKIIITERVRLSTNNEANWKSSIVKQYIEYDKNPHFAYNLYQHHGGWLPSNWYQIDNTIPLIPLFVVSKNNPIKIKEERWSYYSNEQGYENTLYTFAYVYDKSGYPREVKAELQREGVEKGIFRAEFVYY